MKAISRAAQTKLREMCAELREKATTRRQIPIEELARMQNFRIFLFMQGRQFHAKRQGSGQAISSFDEFHGTEQC